MPQYIRWFEDISIADVPLVGGKNASLGEMVRELSSQGVKVPPGFAVTADAYTSLIETRSVGQEIERILKGLDTHDVADLARRGQKIRTLIRETPLPDAVRTDIVEAYRQLSKRTGVDDIDVAVRSSATAEDLPDASFAGQQETFLNVRGEADLLVACQNCFASLYTDRAISYRVNKGFRHSQVRLSIVVQQMVRSDLGSAGVIFTLDTESGFRDVVFVTSAWGLGENVVSGKVDPDEFVVLKPTLRMGKQPILRRTAGAKQFKLVYAGQGTRRTRDVEVSKADRERLSLSDADVIQLSRWACIIEDHYTRKHGRDTPMDIEWGRDGRTGELYILQARPETVQANRRVAEMVTYELEERSKVLAIGRAVGSMIGAGPVRVIQSVNELGSFRPGEVLVADMTDPDWEPVMKKAAAIVTNRGGRTCHAAIVSRELGVPCVVGTGEGTTLLGTGTSVTVSCSEGEEGRIYDGILKFRRTTLDLSHLKAPRTKVYCILGNPDQALKTAMLPVSGVGLAREEFIINEYVKVHPMALVHYDRLKDTEARNAIARLTRGYENDRTRFFVDRLSEGVGMIAGAFYPRPVIVRLSDFKTNEYANLLGGRDFEPEEENPMIGFRGASRYYHERYREGFRLECLALKRVRDEMGLTNLKIMVPFCRTPGEGERVIAEMATHGLKQGENGLGIYVMCEIPSNVIAADLFGKIFDGFSIGSNDLTQLTLGVDRDSAIVSGLFDERLEPVKRMLAAAIDGAHKAGRPIGICGQAPSDYPEICRFLVERGIDSISLNPDSIMKGIQSVLDAEKSLGLAG
ncbi:MAG: phosphoenolpyruvate synthase [Deltaproteobacteria bacterium]|nr:phosphoenolpyruvate synthase [Deltaproteobacteria bacterium]